MQETSEESVATTRHCSIHTTTQHVATHGMENKITVGTCSTEYIILEASGADPGIEGGRG